MARWNSSYFLGLLSVLFIRFLGLSDAVHWPQSSVLSLRGHYPGFAEFTNVLFDSSKRMFVYNSPTDLHRHIAGVKNVWPIGHINATVSFESIMRNIQ